MNDESNSPKPKSLALAVLFGLIFGFLLQKGGVAKYSTLIGVLLLEDFTVIKVMMTAILIGMLGIFTLHELGKIKLHIKPTQLGANIIGGVMFGVGFALLAYCPGTGAAALGQGNWDALFGIAGLVAGSYLFAEMSSTMAKTVEKWGDYGKLTLPEVLHIPRKIFIPIFAVILIGALYALEHYTMR
ncbi:MAG: YeeE/YedE family protein [Parachlamydiaceae bacterium]|nr:YeeE/YedE family protein [Parachlamydiaceae bacterium]